MAGTNDQLTLDILKDHFDTWAKGANLLLVAHGAGLIGCLSILKDYSTTPMLKGVGMLIFIFGTGLMMAMTGYGLVAISRLDAINGLIGEREIRPSYAKFIEWARLLTIWGSGVSLCAGVWQLIIQFIAL